MCTSSHFKISILNKYVSNLCILVCMFSYVYVLFLFILNWGDFFIAFFFFFFFNLDRERGKEREKNWCEREAFIGCLLYAPRLGIVHALTGNQTCNLGICPDQESNLQPFSFMRTFQPTESHQPGQYMSFSLSIN